MFIFFMVLLCVTIKNVCIDSRCILQLSTTKAQRLKLGKRLLTIT